MARHNSTPSYISYVYLLLEMANSFMVRPIQRKLCTMKYSIGNERSKRHGRTTRISRISCFLRSPWFAVVWLSLCPNWMERIYFVDNKLQFYYYCLHLRCCRSRQKMSRLRSQFGVRLNNCRTEWQNHTSELVYISTQTFLCKNGPAHCAPGACLAYSRLL